MITHNLIFPIASGLIIGVLIVRMATWRRRAEVAGYEKPSSFTSTLIDECELDQLKADSTALSIAGWHASDAIPTRHQIPLIFKEAHPVHETYPFSSANPFCPWREQIILLNEVAACRAIALAVRDHGIKITDKSTEVTVYKKGGVRVTVQKRCDHV